MPRLFRIAEIEREVSCAIDDGARVEVAMISSINLRGTKWDVAVNAAAAEDHGIELGEADVWNRFVKRRGCSGLLTAGAMLELRRGVYAVDLR